MVKLVMYQHDYALPGNYSWQIAKVPLANEREEKLWEMMGWKIVEVPEAEAERLLKKMGDSVMFQIELAQMWDKINTSQS